MAPHPAALIAYLRLAAPVLLTSLIAVDPAYACSCVSPGPPCQAVWQSTSVFVARVIEIAAAPDRVYEIETSPGATEQVRFNERRVRLRVTEVFRGDVRTGEVDLFTGLGGGDCGYGFVTGETYLVYGYLQEGRLSTGICSRTRPLRDSADDLTYLRESFRLPAALGSIQGLASRLEETIDGSIAGELPFAGATVVATSGERRYEGQTGRDGRYRMEVPAGRYRISVQVPEGLYVPSTEHEWHVEVPDTRACAAADFVVLADGRISGRVVDARGAPVAGIMVDAVTYNNWLGLPNQKAYAFTDETGAYELTRLPPGRYVIGAGAQEISGANARTATAVPASRILHPGVNDRAAATEIDLGSSQRISTTDIVLPASMTPVPILGTVRDRAGRPIAGAQVYVLHATGSGIAAGPVVTGGDGMFRLAVLAGRYRISSDFRQGTSISVRRQELPPFETSAMPVAFDIVLPD